MSPKTEICDRYAPSHAGSPGQRLGHMGAPSTSHGARVRGSAAPNHGPPTGFQPAHDEGQLGQKGPQGAPREARPPADGALCDRARPMRVWRRYKSWLWKGFLPHRIVSATSRVGENHRSHHRKRLKHLCSLTTVGSRTVAALEPVSEVWRRRGLRPLRQPRTVTWRQKFLHYHREA
jgi:hypothetical protein